jgi:hypothetical protein
MVKDIARFSGLTKQKCTMLVMAMGLVMIYSLWLAHGTYFYHNEGVSLKCAEFSVGQLLHPGMPETFPCSYDHQPLYLLILKGWNKIFSIGPLLSRLPSIFFLTLSVGFFGLWSGTFPLSTLAWVSGLVIFTSMPYLLELNIQIRLYGLLMLQTLLALWAGRLYAGGLLRLRWFLVIAFFGFFNFYLFPLLTFTQIFCYAYRGSRPLSKKAWPALACLLIPFLLKTPYVFWWRLVQRTGGDWATHGAALREFLIIPFSPLNDFWPYWMTPIFLFFGFLCVFSTTQISRDEKLLHRMLFLISLTLVFILHFGFRSNELTPRYFLFYWPLLILNGLVGIETLLKNKKWKSLFISLLTLSIFLVNIFYLQQRPFFDKGHMSPEMNFHLAKSASPYLNSGEEITVTSNVNWILAYYILPYLEEQSNGRPIRSASPQEISQKNDSPIILYYSVSVHERDMDKIFEAQRTQFFSGYEEEQSLWIIRSGWPLTKLHILRRKAL